MASHKKNIEKLIIYLSTIKKDKVVEPKKETKKK